MDIRNLKDYVVLDLETTGFSPAFDEIIEVGAIKVRDSQIVSEFNKIINVGHELPEFITELTGITDEDIRNGEDLGAVLQELELFIEESLIIGHNISFDLRFLNASSIDEYKNDNLDTMIISRRMFKEERHHRLKDLKTRFDIKTESHRALSDTFATFQIFKKLQDNASRNNIEDIDGLLSKHGKRPLLERMKDFNIPANLDEESLIYGKNIVFTGKLERFVRAKAAAISEAMGAIPSDRITSQTNILVIGDTDYVHAKSGNKTTKMLKAEELIKKGSDLIIISETDFYNIIGDENVDIVRIKKIKDRIAFLERKKSELIKQIESEKNTNMVLLTDDGKTFWRDGQITETDFITAISVMTKSIDSTNDNLKSNQQLLLSGMFQVIKQVPVLNKGNYPLESIKEFRKFILSNVENELNSLLEEIK